MRGIPSVAHVFFLLSYLLTVIQSDLRLQLFMFIDLIVIFFICRKREESTFFAILQIGLPALMLLQKCVLSLFSRFL